MTGRTDSMPEEILHQYVFHNLEKKSDKVSYVLQWPAIRTTILPFERVLPAACLCCYSFCDIQETARMDVRMD